MTLTQLRSRPLNIPVATSWLLSDLGELKGPQEPHSRRSPERMRVLLQHALIESAVSPNRIEGVTVDHSRIEQVVLGKSRLTDRDEQEIRGYREALSWIHESHSTIAVSVETIQLLHFLSHGQTGDAGQFRSRDSDIIERYADGRSRARFRTVPAAQVSARMDELIGLWTAGIEERCAPTPLALAAANLDFLCIHPFRDGNGRVSRLLMLLMLCRLGCEVGRYIGLERLIEQSKERYYETLEQSSTGWHEGANDPWAYANFILVKVKSAYTELERQAESETSPHGAKSALVEAAIRGKQGLFSLAELERDCAGVSRDLIRRVLGQLRESRRPMAVSGKRVIA